MAMLVTSTKSRSRSASISFSHCSKPMSDQSAFIRLLRPVLAMKGLGEVAGSGRMPLVNITPMLCPAARRMRSALPVAGPSVSASGLRSVCPRKSTVRFTSLGCIFSSPCSPWVGMPF